MIFDDCGEMVGEGCYNGGFCGGRWLGSRLGRFESMSFRLILMKCESVVEWGDHESGSRSVGDNDDGSVPFVNARFYEFVVLGLI